MKKPVALCIYPPVYDFALYDLFLKPYGLLKISKWLSDNGYKIEFINSLDYTDMESEKTSGKAKRKANGTGKFFRSIIPLPDILKKYNINRNFARYGILKEEIIKKIKLCQPDIILISTGMTYWYKGVLEITNAVKDIYPNIPVIAGGIYVTLMPDHLKKNSTIDFLVKGDGWEELKTILNKLKLPGPNSSPPNFPDPKNSIWKDSAVLRLNNGCPLNCDYCASNLIHKSFKAGDPGNLFYYLRMIYENQKTVNFAFYDDALLINKKTVFIPFLEKVIDSGISFNFYLPNAVHISHIDLETAILMKKAGFKEIRLGYESSSDKFHTTYDNKYNVNSFPDKINILKAAGFKKEEISVYILAGFPRQFPEEVEKSIRDASNTGVHVYIAQFSPVPGTALWKKSILASRYPLAEEPLFHNNTFFPMEWERFTRNHMKKLKNLAVDLNTNI